MFQESNDEDDEIDPVSLFPGKSTSPSFDPIHCNNSHDKLSPKKEQRTSNTKDIQHEEENYNGVTTEAPDDSEYNEPPRKLKMISGDIECNRKSFSIDRLLFSSKQRHMKMPILSSNNSDCGEEKSSQ